MPCNSLQHCTRTFFASFYPNCKHFFVQKDHHAPKWSALSRPSTGTVCQSFPDNVSNSALSRWFPIVSVHAKSCEAICLSSTSLAIRNCTLLYCLHFAPSTFLLQLLRVHDVRGAEDVANVHAYCQLSLIQSTCTGPTHALCLREISNVYLTSLWFSLTAQSWKVSVIFAQLWPVVNSEKNFERKRKCVCMLIATANNFS